MGPAATFDSPLVDAGDCMVGPPPPLPPQYLAHPKAFTRCPNLCLHVSSSTLQRACVCALVSTRRPSCAIVAARPCACVSAAALPLPSFIILQHKVPQRHYTNSCFRQTAVENCAAARRTKDTQRGCKIARECKKKAPLCSFAERADWGCHSDKGGYCHRVGEDESASHQWL